MIWGALAILLSSLYLSPVLACDVDELAFKGKSVDFRDSRLLNLPARSERFGLWLAVEYEGVRALGLSRYVTVDHSQLDRRLKKFFGGYYKYPQSWWPDLTYLAGGEFHAVNDKNHAALARVREVHDSCGF